MSGDAESGAGAVCPQPASAHASAHAPAHAPAHTPAHAAAAAPHIAQLNVSNKSRMHIGPKFVSVTQNVQNVEVIKGACGGLRLEERAAPARRLRCGVAVFACWALVVAAALAAWLLRAALAGTERLDLETGLCRYVWEWARRTSRAERVACAAALSALALCGALLAAFLARPAATPPDVAPHEWNVTRAMWLSRERPASGEPLGAEFVPPRLVVVQHTAGAECTRFADCAATMRNLQDWYLREYAEDIPYNFLIGNDGRVYEGRGWGVHGAHTRDYNRCSIGLGFVGDYRTSVAGGSRVSEAQLERALRLLVGGVAAGHLHARYVALAASDLQSTASPGDDLRAALRRWPHSPRDPAAFHGKTCAEIYATLRAEDAPPPS